MRLLVSGSPRADSANSRLLMSLGGLDPGNEYLPAEYLADLPIFQPERDKAPWPETVLRWRRDLTRAETVFICTPAYLHNIPGVLKNALDWLASSGELVAKPVLAMTFTPAPPRGERAMQSLLWSLSALDARVLTSADLYQGDAEWEDDGTLGESLVREMLGELLSLA